MIGEIAVIELYNSFGMVTKNIEYLLIPLEAATTGDLQNLKIVDDEIERHQNSCL